MEDWVITRSDGLLVAEIGDELVGLHEEAGSCYGLNNTAAWAWKALEQPMRLSELHSGLVNEFLVENSTCDQELRRILREFETEGLVTISTTRARAL